MFDNPLVIIGIIAAIAAVGSILGLLFNSGGSAASDPERHRITLHLGNGETRVFEVNNYDCEDGQLTLYFDDDRQIVVSGAYTAERIRPAKVSLSKGTTTPPTDASSKFTLFENGAVAKELFLSDYDMGDNEVNLSIVGSDDQILAAGCYVIEPITLSPASDVHYAQTDTDDEERFKVQLFQAGRVVREIMASSYESANGVVTITPVDSEDTVIFSGTFVVEQT